MRNLVAIALGANLGDRLKQIQSARDAFEEIIVAGSELLQSSIYKTAPMGCEEGTPDFFNAAIAIEYSGSPDELLTLCKEIEAIMGRDLSPTCGKRNLSRPMDADILYFGQKMIHTETLHIPHPRLLERRFVLEPLAEIQPNFLLPNSSRTIAEHLHKLVSNEPELLLVTKEW